MSAVVAARDAGLPEAAAAGAATEAARSYRTRMAEYADMSVLDVWYSRVDAASASTLFDRAGRAQYEKLLAEAHKHTSQRQMPKLTELTGGGERRIVDHPPLVTHDEFSENRDQIHAIVDGYIESLRDEQRLLLGRFSLEDVARKVVGVGSVGTRCYIALLVTGAGEPLLLQLKQAMASVLEPATGAAPAANNGRRVVTGQRTMQAASDVFLGWASVNGIDLYLRQLYDMKGSPVVASMDAATLAEYVALCAWTLARAHARSGDPAEISGYLGGGDTFDAAVTRFAVAYADQTKHDHAALVEAVHSGRVAARSTPELGPGQPAPDPNLRTAQADAPTSPASVPRAAGTNRQRRSGTAKAISSTAARSGAKSRSPAPMSPPPTATTSGLRTLTSPPTDLPRARAASANSAAGERVARLGRRLDGAGVDLPGGAGERGRLAGGDRGAGPVGDRGPRGDPLEAAGMALVTRRPVRVGGDVAELPGGPRGAGVELAVEDEPAADAGADGEEDEVAGALPAPAVHSA